MSSRALRRLQRERGFDDLVRMDSSMKARESDEASEEEDDVEAKASLPSSISFALVRSLVIIMSFILTSSLEIQVLKGKTPKHLTSQMRL